jgi:hypothetical protein
MGAFRLFVLVGFDGFFGSRDGWNHSVEKFVRVSTGTDIDGASGKMLS